MTPKRRKSRRRRRLHQRLIKRFDEICAELPIMRDALELERSVLKSTKED